MQSYDNYTFASTKETTFSNIMLFRRFYWKRKTPNSVGESGVCRDLLFFKVVPPAIKFYIKGDTTK